MRAFLLILDGSEEIARRALGAVACTGVRSATSKRLFGKGHVVAEEDLPSLRALSGVELPLLALEDGDIHEDEAAMRLGHALAGAGVEARGPGEARAKLVAAHDGLFRVDASALRSLNEIGGVSVYTLFGPQPVRGGTTVAEAKVTPLAVPRATIEEAERVAGRVLTVSPFRALRVSVLVRERLEQAQAERFIDALSKKLQWFGSAVSDAWYVMPDTPPATIASMMRVLLEGKPDVLIVTGGSTANPFDPLLRALDHLPAGVDRLGVPTHPGSMLWLAHAESSGVPVLGVPSCGMFSQVTSLDVLLPLLCAGEELTSSSLAALGEGGLLRGADWRFAPYKEE